jgi:hypothetical protein
MEKLFKSDVLSKRERVERTLNHQAVDRVPIHEQLSYNTEVIALYTGKTFPDFGFSPDDVASVIRQTLDTCFPIFENKGDETYTDADGFTFRNEYWMAWRIGRPFNDERGAARWLEAKISRMAATGLNTHTAVQVEKSSGEVPVENFNAEQVQQDYRQYMTEFQQRVGETVIIEFSFTGFCDLFDAMGLEIFTFFSYDNPDLLEEYMEVAIANELKRVKAVADPALSPVILLPEDFSTKQGPIFPVDFLDRFHYPYVKKLTEAWHDAGIKVVYHSDGNYKKAVPDLIECGVDGFYCLEPNCGMDIIELKRTWPEAVWMGGVNGVDLMESGTPEAVRTEVHRQINETDALSTGGILIATSSEINPPIPAENFKAMVDAVGELNNPNFQ